MNKESVKKAIKEKVKLDDSKIDAICDVLDNNFIIGKGNKEKIISAIVSKTGIDEKTADNVYNQAMSVITGGIKDKLKNPFGK